jgi:hypothetical protein
MTTTVAMDKAVDLGEADAGYAEGWCSSTTSNKTKYGAWYGMDCSAWCAMAVSKWYYDAGFPQPATTSKGFAYTPSGASWYQSKQAWSGPTTNPERGWVVFFYSDSAGRISHVGLVRGPKGSDGLVPTVEGNTNGAGSAEGGSVLLKRRDPNQSLSFRIAGYGRPDLLDGGEWWEMPIPEADQEAIAKEVKEFLQPTFDYLALWIAGRGNRVFSVDSIADRIDFSGTPDWQTPATHAEIDAIENSLKLLIDGTPTATEIAEAVVAALGDITVEGVTQEMIEEAFRTVLNEIVISISVEPPPLESPPLERVQREVEPPQG